MRQNAILLWDFLLYGVFSIALYLNGKSKLLPLVEGNQPILKFFVGTEPILEFES